MGRWQRPGTKLRAIDSRLTFVAREGPHLPRCCGNLSNAGRKEDDNDNSNHNASARHTLRGVVEDLDRRLTSRRVEDACEIAEAENVCDANKDQHKCV